MPPRARNSQVKVGFNAATSRTPLARWGAAPRAAFTMVELLAAIAIIALLVAVIVPAVGNYVQMAKRTADKQTLTVLNDALTRYKTQGGDLTALTSGASIGNVLTKLQTAVTWCGMRHQFLRTGTTYTAASLSAINDGAQYKFTRYGDFADGTEYSNGIINSIGADGYDVGDETEFKNWLAEAMAETGSTNYLALMNHDTTNLFDVKVCVARSGAKVRVWWGDGTTQDYNTISTSSETAISKTWGTFEKRSIVIVGDISRLVASYTIENALKFGGDITTMKSLIYIYLANYFNGTEWILSELNASGDLDSFSRDLTYIMCTASNTLSGNLADLPTGVIEFGCKGQNTISGDISDLPNNLTTFTCEGNNTVNGDITNLPDGLTYFYCTGSNAVSGDLQNLPTGITSFVCTGNNVVTGNLSNLPTDIKTFNCWGKNTVIYNTNSGGRSWPSGMQYFYLRPGNSWIFTSAMTDALLIDLSAVSSWTGDKLISLQGACGARTSASDAAVATLQANGVTVLTN